MVPGTCAVYLQGTWHHRVADDLAIDLTLENVAQSLCPLPHHFHFTTDYCQVCLSSWSDSLTKSQLPSAYTVLTSQGPDAQRTVFHRVCEFPLSVAWFAYRILCWILPLGHAHKYHSLLSALAALTLLGAQGVHKEELLAAAQPWHGQPWSAADILSDATLEKTDFPFNSGYQLQLASRLGAGLCDHFLFAVLGFCLVWSAGLVCAVSLCECMCPLPWRVWKIVWPSNYRNKSQSSFLVHCPHSFSHPSHRSLETGKSCGFSGTTLCGFSVFLTFK